MSSKSGKCSVDDSGDAASGWLMWKSWLARLEWILPCSMSRSLYAEDADSRGMACSWKDEPSTWDEEWESRASMAETLHQFYGQDGTGG